MTRSESGWPIPPAAPRMATLKVEGPDLGAEEADPAESARTRNDRPPRLATPLRTLTGATDDKLSSDPPAAAKAALEDNETVLRDDAAGDEAAVVENAAAVAAWKQVAAAMTQNPNPSSVSPLRRRL